ncbi:hypothetical protein H8959_006903 [Pygathrix nigripes]
MLRVLGYKGPRRPPGARAPRVRRRSALSGGGGGCRFSRVRHFVAVAIGNELAKTTPEARRSFELVPRVTVGVGEDPWSCDAGAFQAGSHWRHPWDAEQPENPEVASAAARLCLP